MLILETDLEAKGYHIWKASVPVLNEAKTKLYIGVGIRRHNVNGTVTTNATTGEPLQVGLPLQQGISGTVTYVVDYPIFEKS